MTKEPENTKTRATIKAFIKRAEAIGLNVAVSNIKYDLDGPVSGASFSCDVDVLKFIDNVDEDGSMFPRTREKFKEGDFKIRVIRINQEFKHSETMQVSMEDSIKEESEDLKDVLGSTLEGKSLPDKVAELGELVLQYAKQMADELYQELEKESKPFLTIRMDEDDE